MALKSLQLSLSLDFCIQCTLVFAVVVVVVVACSVFSFFHFVICISFTPILVHSVQLSNHNTEKSVCVVVCDDKTRFNPTIQCGRTLKNTHNNIYNLIFCILYIRFFLFLVCKTISIKFPSNFICI